VTQYTNWALTICNALFFNEACTTMTPFCGQGREEPESVPFCADLSRLHWLLCGTARAQETGAQLVLVLLLLPSHECSSFLLDQVVNNVSKHILILAVAQLPRAPSCINQSAK
jgi:hypothetical protein